MTCPAGSELRSGERKSLLVEYCRDSRSGLREGPFRILRKDGGLEAEGTYRAGKLDGGYRMYNQDGEVAWLIEYARGERRSERLTRAGLEDIVREQNAQARKDGKNWQIAVRDEHTLEYIVTMRAPFSWVFTPDEGAMRERLLAEPVICKMFDMPANLQTIVARYVDGDSEDLLAVPIQRSACRK